MRQVKKCLICDRRPANGNGTYCHNCFQKLEAEKRKKKTQNKQPDRYLVYQDFVVALFKNGEDTHEGRLVNRSIDELPKRGDKVLNLNEYCPGYTREQVKHLKAGILRLAYNGIN